MFETETSLVVEWYFDYEYKGIKDEFDGVSLIDFEQDKIVKLTEFQAKAVHVFPYKD